MQRKLPTWGIVGAIKRRFFLVGELCSVNSEPVCIPAFKGLSNADSARGPSRNWCERGRGSVFLHVVCEGLRGLSNAHSARGSSRRSGLVGRVGPGVTEPFGRFLSPGVPPCLRG